MKKMFTKEVERLINPINVGSMHFIQAFNRLLPKKIQSFLVKASSKKIPYMGFVVEPYSLFLCHEINDIELAQNLLPKHFKLIKTAIFEDDKPKYYALFGCFKAHTSAFWGFRTEFYVIAKDTRTNLLTWVIIDYDTNTISYDSKHGLRSPNVEDAVMTIDHRGTIYVDVNNQQQKRNLNAMINVEDHKVKALDQRLWLEGNLSVAYGRELSNDGDVFGLKFEPCEVEKAWLLPKENIQLEISNWYPGLFKENPDQVLCFPYAQHFLSDSPGSSSNINNEEELVKAINNIEFEKIKTFDASSFKRALIINMIISFIITTILIILLIIK